MLLQQLADSGRFFRVVFDYLRVSPSGKSCPYLHAYAGFVIDPSSRAGLDVSVYGIIEHTTVYNGRRFPRLPTISLTSLDSRTTESQPSPRSPCIFEWTYGGGQRFFSRIQQLKRCRRAILRFTPTRREPARDLLQTFGMVIVDLWLSPGANPAPVLSDMKES